MSRDYTEPKTKKGQQTLDKIMKVAIDEFGQKGYSVTSIYDIVSKSEVAVGTFYRYFSSKYDLYKKVLLYLSHDVRKNMSLAVKGCKTRLETEKVAVKAWLNYIIKNPSLYKVIGDALYVDKQLYFDYYDGFCRAYMKHIEEAQKSGEIRQIDSRIVSLMIMGASDFLGKQWALLTNDPQLNVEYVAEKYMKFIENGIKNQLPNEVNQKN